MKEKRKQLRTQIKNLIKSWENRGSLPPHSTLEEQGRNLLEWKREKEIESLWDSRRVMLSTTLDDGLGQGLRIINLFGEAAGLKVISLGLMQPVERIVQACHRYQPEILGMTVLQFDSEEKLIQIREQISPTTQIVAGGPVFKADPDFAKQTGVDFAAGNVAVFLAYLLKRE